MQYTYINIKQKKNIACLYLNRPDKLNAICFKMVEEIYHAVSTIDTINNRALFIFGAEKAFSAGGDLKEMQQLEQKEAEHRSNFIHKTFLLIRNLDIPTVAFIQGICFGGGLEIALHCDIRICDNTVRFAFPEVKYGIIPGAGGTVQFPIQVGESAAAYYLLTGDEFNHDTAQKIGLVQKVVSSAKFKHEIDNQIAFYSKTNPDSLKAIKQTIKLSRKSDLDTQYSTEAELFSKLLFKNGKLSIGENFIKKQ